MANAPLIPFLKKTLQIGAARPRKYREASTCWTRSRSWIVNWNSEPWHPSTHHESSIFFSQIRVDIIVTNWSDSTQAPPNPLWNMLQAAPCTVDDFLIGKHNFYEHFTSWIESNNLWYMLEWLAIGKPNFYGAVHQRVIMDKTAI